MAGPNNDPVMSAEPGQHAETVRVEWGFMLDCDKQGCDSRHDDHGRVFRWDGYLGDPRIVEHLVNEHATSLVRRTVTETPWVRQ